MSVMHACMHVMCAMLVLKAVDKTTDKVVFFWRVIAPPPGGDGMVFLKAENDSVPYVAGTK